MTGLSRVRLEKRIAEARGPETQVRTVRQPLNVVLFEGNSTEVPLIKTLAKGNLKTISKADAASVLNDPKAFSNVSVIVWGQMRWRLTPAELFNDANLNSLRRFVQDGGDMILMDQYSAFQMESFKKAFGVTVNAAGGGAAKIVSPELLAMVQQTGATEATLAEIDNSNHFSELPEKSVVLIRNKRDLPTVAVVPYGSGRLILIGLKIGKKQQKLLESTLKIVYPSN